MFALYKSVAITFPEQSFGNRISRILVNPTVASMTHVEQVLRLMSTALRTAEDVMNLLRWAGAHPLSGFASAFRAGCHNFAGLDERPISLPLPLARGPLQGLPRTRRLRAL